MKGNHYNSSFTPITTQAQFNLLEPANCWSGKRMRVRACKLKDEITGNDLQQGQLTVGTVYRCPETPLADAEFQDGSEVKYFRKTAVF